MTNTDVVLSVGEKTAAASALFSFLTLCVALYAARTWLYGLKRQRRDDCVGSLEWCRGAIGRAIDDKVAGRATENSISQAWLDLRRFRQTFAVARLYSRRLPLDIVDDGVAILNEMSQFCSNESSGKRSAGDAINARMSGLVTRLETEVRRHMKAS